MQIDLEAHVSLHHVPLYPVDAKLPFSISAISSYPGAPMHIIYAIF